MTEGASWNWLIATTFPSSPISLTRWVRNTSSCTNTWNQCHLFGINQTDGLIYHPNTVQWLKLYSKHWWLCFSQLSIPYLLISKWKTVWQHRIKIELQRTVELQRCPELQILISGCKKTCSFDADPKKRHSILISNVNYDANMNIPANCDSYRTAISV